MISKICSQASVNLSQRPALDEKTAFHFIQYLETTFDVRFSVNEQATHIKNYAVKIFCLLILSFFILRYNVFINFTK